jgi:hypothetical protein
MAPRELILGPHIEQRNQVVTQSRDQVVTRDGLKRITGLKVIGHNTTYLGDIPFTDASERFDQRDHFGIASETIENMFAATLGLDKTRSPQYLQVPRRIREGQMCPSRQLLDGADPLRKVLQELKPVSMAKRLRYLGKVFIDRLFRSRA